MGKKFTGIVRGSIIELDESPGLADGERVKIELETESHLQWGEGIKRSAGALAEDVEFGKAMEQIQLERKSDSRPAVEL
ncbi:MAG: hypothetical protein JXM70_02830 [Pirellulales bacterium]|nr:hypothetical protein [Pirellulales bacterium]